MKYLWGILLVPCLLGYAWADEPLDLADAARLALNKAPAFAAALAARDASLEDRNIGLAGLLPFTEIAGEFTHHEQTYHYTIPKSFLSEDVVFNRLKFAIRLVQPLFRLDRWAEFQQGKLAADIGELKLSLARQTLLLQVSVLYTDVLVAQEDVMAAKAQEQAVSRLRAQAQAAFDVGTATVNDALEAESRLDLVRAAHIQANHTLNTARVRLDSLIGEKAGYLSTFSETMPLDTPEPKQAEPWRNRAMQHALSVRIAEKKLTVAKKEMMKNIGRGLPSVDMVAGLGRDKTTDNLFGTGSIVKDEELGIQVHVPLYAGGGTRAQFRKSVQLKVAANFELQDARRESGLAAMNAFLRVQSTVARVKALKKAVVSANRADQAAQAGYEAGLRTIGEQLDAAERSISARRDLVRAKAEYLLAVLQLYASDGSLDISKIEKINRLVDDDEEEALLDY